MEQAESLLKVLKEPKNTEKSGKASPRVIAIASGKGGVGKTNLSINLGIAMSKLGKEVIVMDADLGLANVNVILGIIPKFNLYNVIKGQKSFRDIIIDTPDGVKIIAGASGFSQLANLDNEQKDNFIQAIENLDFIDTFIIDTSAGITDNVVSFLLAADDILIITTPEPTAITDAYGIIKSIASKTGNPNIKLVVNRVRNESEAEKVSDRVIHIANQFLNVKVKKLGFILEDIAVQQAVIAQRAFYTMNPNSKASKNIEEIAFKLENLDAPQQKGGLAGFFKNIMKSYKT